MTANDAQLNPQRHGYQTQKKNITQYRHDCQRYDDQGSQGNNSNKGSNFVLSILWQKQSQCSWMLLIENESLAYQYHLQLIVQLQVMVVNPIGYLTLALTNMLPLIFNSLSIRYPTKDPTML